MKKCFYSSLLFALFSLFIISCDDDDEPVNLAPVITVTSPTPAEFNAGFQQGQNITISGTVEDDVLINTITTQIFYNNIDTNLGETITVDQKTAAINEVVNTSSAPAGNYRIVITATDDQGLSSTFNEDFVLR